MSSHRQRRMPLGHDRPLQRVPIQFARNRAQYRAALKVSGGFAKPRLK